MKTLLRILVTLPGVLFVVIGLRWAVDPTGAAAELGMSLLEGVGRSSQIADVGALFLAMGLMMLHRAVGHATAAGLLPRPLLRQIPGMEIADDRLQLRAAAVDELSGPFLPAIVTPPHGEVTLLGCQPDPPGLFRRRRTAHQDRPAAAGRGVGGAG